MTDALAIDHHKLNTVYREYSGVAKALEGLPCDTEAEERDWAARLNAVCTVLKSVNEEHQEIKGPINRDARRVDEVYRTARTPLEELKELCKKKLAIPAQRRLEAQAEATFRLTEAASSGDSAGVQSALANLPDDVKVEGVSSRVSYGFFVVDPAAIPREYLQIDAEKVKLAIKSGVREIQGLDIVALAKVQRTKRKGEST